jgi:hypothetical protein
VTPLHEGLLKTWGAAQLLTGWRRWRNLQYLEREVHKGVAPLDVPAYVFPLKPTLR